MANQDSTGGRFSDQLTNITVRATIDIVELIGRFSSRVFDQMMNDRQAVGHWLNLRNVTQPYLNLVCGSGVAFASNPRAVIACRFPRTEHRRIGLRACMQTAETGM